jgi:hypothetical protein
MLKSFYIVFSFEAMLNWMPRQHWILLVNLISELVAFDSNAEGMQPAYGFLK